MSEIPEIPLSSIAAPTSIDLTDDDNVYPLLEAIVGNPSPDSVGPEAGNRQPRALDLRTESLRTLVNQVVAVVNSLNENLLHRDGVDATVDGLPSPSSMRGDLDMGDDPLAPVLHKVVNMADGVADTDAAAKQQLDVVQTFLDGLLVQLNGALRTDGTNAMLATLNMGSQRIEFMADPINVSDAVTKSYMDTETLDIRADHVKRDGSSVLIGNLNLGGFKVINMNLAAPTLDGDGVSRGYLLTVLAAIAATPSGTVAAYAGAIAPTGWFLCDGSVVSQTTFAALFAIVSTTYNTGGEGAGNFRLPDLRGRIPVGLDNMGGPAAGVITDGQGIILGGVFGDEEHTLTVAEMPSHAHQYDDQYVGTSSTGAEDGPSATNLNADFTEELGRTTTSAGSGNAHANVQPVMAMNIIIKQ